MFRRALVRLSRFRGGSNFRQCKADGFSIIVNTNDDVGEGVYTRRFEMDAQRFIQANTKPEDVCFDVGANIGYFALTMSCLAHKGTVYAFDPVPLNYHILSANAQLNHAANLRTYQSAVGDKPGISTFVVSQDSAYSSFVDTGRQPINETISVQTVSLDSFCDENGIARIDFLKVDVEGAEPLVIAGAKRVLSDPARRPRAMVLELYNPMLTLFKSSIAEMVEQMAGYGYRAQVDDGTLREFTGKDHDILYNVFFTC
jgi:FkbM family methyltransferase